VKLEKGLRQYSGETIFFTRIAGPFGATVNFLSGLIEVPYKQFFIFDVLGNLVDISLFIITGYILGDYWQDFLNKIQYFGLVVFLVFILSILFRIYRQKLNKG
jgi:membrane-associated protein